MKKIFRGTLSVIVLLTSFLMFNKGVEAKTTTPKALSIQETKKTTPLFLQHANNLFEKSSQGLKYAWHYSHGSHGSHGSHASHYSHYSGRY